MDKRELKYRCYMEALEKSVVTDNFKQTSTN